MYLMQAEAPVESIGFVWTIILGLLGSGVLSSFITLFGVRRANIAAAKRQEADIAARFEQQRIDREMSLRKDLFLAGSAAVGNMRDHIASFTNPIQQSETYTTLKDGSTGHLNRVELVAPMEMLRAFQPLHQHYSSSITALIIEKAQVLIRLADVEQSQSNLDNLAAQFGPLVANHTQSGGAPTETAAVEDLLTRLRLAEDHLIGSRRTAASLAFAITRHAVNATFEFDRLYADVLCITRRELGFDLPLEEYLNLLDESVVTLRGSFDEGMVQLDATLEQISERDRFWTLPPPGSVQ